MFGPPPPPCAATRLASAELDLVLAGDDAELLREVVGAVADLADLVGDPELEALRRVGREIGIDLLLAAVLEGRCP